MISMIGLWLISLSLSAVALLIMTGLIVARWVHARTTNAQKAERARLIPLLLAAAPVERSTTREGRNADLLADLTVELIELVRGEDKEHLVTRARAMSVSETLRKRLKSRSPRVRITAIEALVHFNDSDTVKALTRALDDRNSEVRLTAALALGVLGAVPPSDVLLDKLGIGSRENSMLALSLFQEIARTRPDETRALIAAPVPSAVKAAAIQAITSTGDYSLVPMLADLALDADAHVEDLPQYLRALGRFEHPAAAKAIRHCLLSPVWFVRSAAAEAAGRVRLLEAAMDLARLLSDESWWVKFRAGEALVRLGEPGIGLLREMTKYGSEKAKRSARLTLQERGL